MKNLNEMLRAKELQLAQLQKEVEALRISAKILADEDVLPRRGKAGKKPRTVNLPSGVVPTQPVMIRSVLLEKGEPLHVKKIAEAIKKKFGVKFKPLYLTSIIYRLMKKDKLFRKAGANTFGLLEWPSAQHTVNSAEPLRVQ